MLKMGRRELASGDSQCLPQHSGRCTGVGRCHSPDQIMNVGRTITPVDYAVFGPTSAEVTAVRQILSSHLDGSIHQCRKCAIKRRFCRDGDFLEYLERVVVRKDGHTLLIDDSTGIRLFHHFMQRRTSFNLTFDNRPVDRYTTAILGQQRAVHVVRAARHRGEQGGFEHHSVVERKQEVSLERGDLCNEFWRIGIVRHRDGNIVGGSEFGDAAEPDVLARAIVVRND